MRWRLLCLQDFFCVFEACYSSCALSVLQGLDAESEGSAQKTDVQGLTLESISNAMDAKSGG